MPNTNVTHMAKMFDADMQALADDISSIEPSNENITERAKLFFSYMEWFKNNQPSGGGSSDILIPPEMPLPDVTVTIT